MTPNMMPKMTKVEKHIINTDKAPGAIGPYSQAVRVGNFLFLSGQIPLDPQTGAIVEGGVEAQASRVLKNVQGILESEGLELSNLVKTTIFIKDMNEFTKVNEIYSRFVPAPFPARSTVEVARLPKDVKIEIEAIAFYPNA
jgi:2-iminobutanoate/2-iminopropanoate deaminase